MRNIIIYSKDETESYTLPKVRDMQNGGEVVYKEVQMAAGNLVHYVQGYRAKLSINFDYFPADLLADIMGLIRQGGWFRVDYPDTNGTDKTGYFKITPGTMGVFKFADGKPVWRGLKLDFVARELEV